MCSSCPTRLHLWETNFPVLWKMTIFLLRKFRGVRMANEILMYFRRQRKSSQDVSLSDYIETGTDGAALSLMEVLREDTDLLEQVDARENARLLRRAVRECLTPLEQQVIAKRYGLFGQQSSRQREVADAVGLSRSYVSRIEKRALEKLRSAMES